MLRDVVQFTMAEELPKFGLLEGRDYTFLRAEHTIRLFGTEILLRSGDRPDSLRGLNVDDFAIDEAREFKDSSIFEIMIGRLRKSKDGQWFIATTTKMVVATIFDSPLFDLVFPVINWIS